MSLFTVGRSGLLAPVAPCGWWPAEAGVAYGANPATLGFRNDHGVLNFDDTVEEAIVFHGVAPAALGANGLVVSLDVMAASAVIGTAVFSVAIERVELAVTDIDSDNFGPAWTTEVAVAGTSGVPTRTTVSFALSETGGLVAGEPYRVLVKRKVGDARDDLVGDAQILRVFVEESATVLISKTASTILGVLLLSWHAADVASSFTLAGSLVDQWRDISGNGHHVDQAGVLRPEYDTAESHGISLNGRNGVWFTPAQYLLGTTTPVTAAGFYVWCAATSDDTTVFTLLCSFADTGTVNNSWVLFLFGPTGGDPALWEAQAGATFSDVLTTNGYSANTVHVARVHEAAVNDHRIALDGGTEATEATPVAPSGVDRMGIGVNARGAGAPLDPQFNSNGYVLEVAVANATGITPQQVSDMDVLTAFKWGAATP